jgi:sterol-4alpha-carboxylate 3-dehydrogenase (decarboxylating)
MYWIAMILAFFVRLLRPIVHIEPTFTPLRVTAASATRYFNISKAKKELGYKPLVSMEEGLKRSVEWLKQLDQDKKNS